MTVPTNSTLTIHKQTVMIHPIIDEFYSADPAHSRSPGLAQAKGQTVTGPDKRVLENQRSSSPAKNASERDYHVVNEAIQRLEVH